MSDQLATHLNGLSSEPALAELRKCCGSAWWCEQMLIARPFADNDAVRNSAERIFDAMPREAWLEAFASHPRIGDLESLKMRLAGNRQWSAGEQSGVAEADEQLLTRLRDANDAYLEKFGYVFIVCATGKSADEMLEILERRLKSVPDAELLEAGNEQRKITRLRLDKLAASLDDR